MTLTDKVKSIAENELSKGINLLKEDSKSIGTFANEGIRSTAYIYPLYGIVYFIRHPQLFKSVQPIIYKSAIMSSIILALFFLFTYLPQVAMLAFVSGPLAFIGAVPLVFIEAWAVISFFNKTLLVSAASEKIFDAVLLQKGLTELVEKGRVVKGGRGGQGLTLEKSLLRPVTSGKFSTEGLIRYILTLPLNAIPAVGTIFFLLYNGSHSGPSHLSHYFQLKSFTSTQRQAFVEKRSGAFTSFGTVALALNMIPVVGILFEFTTSAGAALWAVDLEKSDKGKGVEITEARKEVEMGRDEL